MHHPITDLVGPTPRTGAHPVSGVPAPPLDRRSPDRSDDPHARSGERRRKARAVGVTVTGAP